jgi:putative ABC transport system permease protein
MIKNYLKIALRNMLRHRGLSLLNISGLAIGMACCFLVFLWVQDELSFDRFHQNARQIHRVLRNSQGTDIYNPYNPGPVGPALKSDYTEIINAARTFGNASGPLKYKNRIFNAGICGADPSFFEIFTFPFLKGDPRSCLSDPRSIVLTQEIASRLFDDEDPLGKTVGFEWWGKWHDLKVTGIIKDIPHNSSIQFDYILPFEFVTWSGMTITDWDIGAYPTYVLLNKEANPEKVQAKISGTIKRHFPESQDTLFLEPLTRIHLHHFTGSGPINYVYIFSIIGLLVLGIACINFMNLSTARSLERAKEVGMRKVVGSSRSQLIKQFLGESILLSLISFIAALMLVRFFLPFVNDIVGKQMSFPSAGGLFFIFLGISLFTGFFTGIYPAVFLSRFQPIAVLKGRGKSDPRSIRLRKYMVIGQFVISIALICSTVIIYQQLIYMKSKDMGINKHHVINLELRSGLRNQFRTIKTELTRYPDILAVSATNASFSKFFGSDRIGWEGKPEGKKIFMAIHATDFEYQKIFDIKMAQGRFFSRDHPSDLTDGIVINETAARIMGMENPIGQRISCWLPFDPNRTGTIIGVARDFHFRSLHEKISPLVIVIAPEWFTDMYIRINSENTSGTIGFIEKTIRRLAPDYPVEYTFLDEDIDSLYKNETQIASLIKYGTFLAIFIACLGLFGLASFTAERSTKEIGIRKVLGASVPGIMLFFSKGYTKWVLLANLMAWPITWFAISKWLNHFAYRIELSIWTFCLSGLAALMIALLTVSYQSIKAATANPVKSLRYE